MRLARFSTVRGRLLALLVAIALPIACLTALAALTTYQTVSAAIEVAQARTADDFAVRTRVWQRGALRTLLAAGSVIANASLSGSDCQASIRDVLSLTPGYRAIRFALADGRICFASNDASITDVEMAGIAERMGRLPRSVSRSSIGLPEGRFDQILIGQRDHLASQVRLTGDAPLRDGLLLADPDLLDQVFDLGDAGEGVDVAMVSQGKAIVMHRDDGSADMSWLPQQSTFPADGRRWEALSRAGKLRTYTARLVTEPDLYIVASFSNAPELAARMQFVALLVAPILTLILLCLVYLRAIDRHCVHWLRGIEAAARARSSEPNVRAVIAEDMPSDIRSVAEAFNTMVEEREVRQRRLQTALDDNRFLVRELHHRVKNSLQVVQSYIGLTKRDYRDEARLALADAETRVHVLSSAYRFTLADGEMQPVRVDLFIEDVATMITNLIRGRDQWVTSRLDTTATLSVDRIIPLGFLVVDVASRVLRATPGVSVTIIVRDIDESTLEIALEADRDIAPSEPPKIFAGLVAQIEAVPSEQAAGRKLGSWRVRHSA